MELLSPFGIALSPASVAEVGLDRSVMLKASSPTIDNTLIVFIRFF